MRAGVLVYFVLSKGTHPFGNRFKRNGNIVDGVFELAAARGWRQTVDCRLRMAAT